MKTTLQRLTEEYGLQKINSATKYPSIFTYHQMNKGVLEDNLTNDESFDGKPVYITEKIDGSNGRIILSTNSRGIVSDFYIGSREDILYAMGDRIMNPALSMAEVLDPYARSLILLSACPEYHLKPNSIYVLYGENYGGNNNGHKQYTSRGNKDIRFFDAFYMSAEDFSVILQADIQYIARWRDENLQPFMNVSEFTDFCQMLHLDTVPYLIATDGDEIPTDIENTFVWLAQFEDTCAPLDDDYCGPGRAEGVVVRTEDRKMIRKIRFEDYEKTFKRKNK